MTDAPSPWLGAGHLLRLRADPLAFWRDMQARHGDRVRIRLGPYRSWLVFDPGGIETVLATHAADFVHFEPVMRVLAQWNGSSFLVSEGEAWRRRRRQVMPAFAHRRLSGYGARVAPLARARREAWRAMAEPGSRTIMLDTDREMAALALDIAADTLFGDSLPGGAAMLAGAIATLSEVAFRETTWPVRPPGWLPWPGRTRKLAAMATLDAVVTGIVTRRLALPDDDRGDLLSILTEGGAAARHSIRDNAVSLLIAGHETSGAALAWASLLLGGHPAVLRDVLAELDAALEGGRLPGHEDLDRLPLLRAVVQETLRLYPPAYALFPRRATADVPLGDGSVIRRGELVQVIPYVTQRDPRWFDAPDEFRPRRFMGLPAWPRYALVPFGAGPRVCIAAGFATMELGLVLATLLQGLSPMPVERGVSPKARFSLRPRGGLAQGWAIRGP